MKAEVLNELHNQRWTGEVSILLQIRMDEGENSLEVEKAWPEYILQIFSEDAIFADRAG